MKSPGCSVWCWRASSPGSVLWKVCPTKAWLFLRNVIRPLQYWNISLFIRCRSKEVEARGIEHPVIISKGGSLWVQKGWIWDGGPSVILLAEGVGGFPQILPVEFWWCFWLVWPVLNTEDGSSENAVELAKQHRLALIFDQQNEFPSHCGVQEGSPR